MFWRPPICRTCTVCSLLSNCCVYLIPNRKPDGDAYGIAACYVLIIRLRRLSILSIRTLEDWRKFIGFSNIFDWFSNRATDIDSEISASSTPQATASSVSHCWQCRHLCLRKGWQGGQGFQWFVIRWLSIIGVVLCPRHVCLSGSWDCDRASPPCDQYIIGRCFWLKFKVGIHAHRSIFVAESAASPGGMSSFSKKLRYCVTLKDKKSGAPQSRGRSGLSHFL